MHRNMKEWTNSLLQADLQVALPILTYPGLEITGKSILEVVTHGVAQYECIQALSEQFPSAATVTIMDLSVEAEAFGSNIKFQDNEVPTVVGRIVFDEDSIDALIIPEIGAGRTGVYLETTRLAAEGISQKPIFGGMIGPYSLAGRLFDMTEIMISVMIEPEIIEKLLDKCTQYLISYCKAFREAGANGVIIAEPAAGLLSPSLCSSYSSAYVKRIVEAVQTEDFMIVLHNCGNTVPLVPSMLETGAMGLHFGNSVNMVDILPQIPAHILAMGNIDPVSFFKAGTPSSMHEAVTSLLHNMKPYKNFLLSSGCDVPPGTPFENVKAFYAALDAYNQR